MKKIITPFFYSSIQPHSLKMLASAHNERAVAIGADALASGFNSFSCGSATSASGNFSFASGIGMRAKSFAGSTWEFIMISLMLPMLLPILPHTEFSR
ncbi:MAG: hypothetical protein H7Y86_21395 [Rhizobacter sp.]|nr:hypothetical protein [Ferruginibacter sp.]